jgi:hypothetical protein
MATKFSQLYKQELKSKGILSSLGSAALKQSRERMDVRNTFFGGQGMLSITGQKIFGKGYSPIGKTSSILSSSPTSASATADSQGITDLLSSSERQESLLRVISKNTFNMNMMARDTNITRQNIVTLTKKMTGRSSRSQDALWYDVRTRNTAVDSLSKKTNQTSQPGNTTPSSSTGSSSFIGSMIGGLMGTGGSLGAGILRTIGTIASLSPILGIVGLAASAYAIGQMATNIDFGQIKKQIAAALGIDTQSETPIIRQLAENFDNFFNTRSFTDIYDWVNKTIGPQVNQIGESISNATKITLAYSKAAFDTLIDNFGQLGKIFGFYFGEFINRYKPELLATLGAAIGGAVGSMFGIKGAALGALIGAGSGYILGRVTQSDDPQKLQEKKKDIEDQMSKIKNDTRPMMQLEHKRLGEELADVEGRIKAYGEKEKAVTTMPGVRNWDANLASAQKTMSVNDGNWGRESRQLSTTPIQVSARDMASLIYTKFKDAGFNDAQAKAAIANAMAESSLNPNAENHATNPKTGKQEHSYGLFQVNRSAHPQFSAEDLKNPEKNIDAMISIMKSNQKDFSTFKSLTDENAATAYFMKKFERPADQSDAKVNERLQNLNRIPGDILNASSRALADASRTDTSAPNVTVVNQQAAAPPPAAPPQNAAASTHNFDPWVEIWSSSILNPAGMRL